MKTILVTGSKGQLGNELQELAKNIDGFVFKFEDIDTLDITNYDSVEKYVDEESVDIIINAAAYTAVDKAETDLENAIAVNTIAPENLAKIAEKYLCKLIHVSTDYVYNGTNSKPYKEDEPVNPINVYGKTKYDGEQAILNSKAQAVIVRTSWLYSSFGNNFVKTMLRLSKEREEVNVVFDQIGTPTYAADLAKAIIEITIQIMNAPLVGGTEIYHFSNEGVCSWYDFACEIMGMTNSKCKVFPIETKDFPTPAKRPSYSVLNKAKIKSDFNITIPFWGDSLRRCIGKLSKV